MDQESRIYLIKNITPWMVEELISFSENILFTVILLREPNKFYEGDLKKLRKNGIKVLIKPFTISFSFSKIKFSFKYILSHFKKISFDYNDIILIKSIWWFLLIDKKIFEKKNVSIHAQFATQPSLISLLFKKFYGYQVKYHITFHAYDIFFENKWFPETINNSSLSFSISEYNLRYIEKNYREINTSKITLARLGVQTKNSVGYDLIHKKETGTSFRIGFLGWFVEKKGISYLLEAMKRISEKYQDVDLVVAGGGSLKNKVLDFIEENNLNEVINYLGVVRDDEKESFFRDIDAFILPSISLGNDKDGIPVVLMEAISYGLPLISTNVSGIPEICKDKVNGELIPERDVDAIQVAVKKLKDNKKLLIEYSKNSINIFNHSYNIDKNSRIKLKKMEWIP